MARLNKTAAVLQRAFWVLFLLCFALVFLLAYFSPGRLPWLLLGAALLGGVCWLCHCTRIRERWLFIAFGLCFLAFLGAQLATVWRVAGMPEGSGDVEALYTAVNELVTHGHLTDSNLYFLNYPHQTFLLFELFAISRVQLMLGGTAAVPYLLYAVVAALGISLSVVLFMASVRLFLGNRSALATGFVMLGLLPFISGAVYAYSHNMCYPFIFGGVFLLALSFKVKKPWRGVLCVALAGVLLACASLITGSLTVLVIASVIFLALRLGAKQLLLRGGALLLAFAAVSLGFRFFWAHSGLADMRDARMEEFPITHWIWMGMQPEGLFSEEVYQATRATPGIEAKKAYHLEQMGQRMDELGFGGMVKHQAAKLNTLWDTLPFNWSYAGADALPDFSNGVYGAMLLLALACGATALKKPQPGFEFFCALSLMGCLFFFQIWESASRYLYPYLPFLVLVAVVGAVRVGQLCAPVLQKRAKRAESTTESAV